MEPKEVGGNETNKEAWDRCPPSDRKACWATARHKSRPTLVSGHRPALGGLVWLAKTRQLVRAASPVPAPRPPSYLRPAVGPGLFPRQHHALLGPPHGYWNAGAGTPLWTRRDRRQDRWFDPGQGKEAGGLRRGRRFGLRLAVSGYLRPSTIVKKPTGQFLHPEV